uniref:Uncharacterized protein n=1 Tax=candidate division WWE3 bacterium TaxID=2053526 RepID=A0A7C4TKI8_UNCKA
MKLDKFLFKSFFAFLILVGPILNTKMIPHSVVWAANPPDFSWMYIAGPSGETTGFNTLEDLLAGGVNIMLGIAISASFIAIIVSGSKYIMARGDAKAAAEAKQSLTYSITGFILAVSSFAILNVIIKTIGGESAQGVIWLVEP